MKKQLLTGVFAVMIIAGMAMAPVNEDKTGVDATEELRETVSLNFIVNESAYGTLQRQSGERGISGEEFGRWIVENVQSAVNLGHPPGVFEPENYNLMIMKLDANGRIAGEETLTLRKSGGEKVELPRDIVRVLNRFFPNETLFPEIGQTFFKEDSIFPRGAVGSGSSAEVMREFSRNAGQLMQRAAAGMDTPAGIGLLLLPDERELKPDTSVEPGAVLFIKNTATS